MSKNIREELLELRFQYQFIEKVPCVEEEVKTYYECIQNDKPLPEGVYYSEESEYQGEAAFYTIKATGLSVEDKEEYLKLKKLQYLNTIKRCLVYFTTLSIISLVSGILATMIAFL